MAERSKNRKKSSVESTNSNNPGRPRKDTTDGNGSVNSGKSRRESTSVAVGVIKTPGGGKKERENEPVPTGRRKPTQSEKKSEKGDNEKQGNEKGILKKPTKGRSKATANRNTSKEPAKKKVPKKTLFDKLGKSLGFYIGTVTLTDPWAIEAAQALDLRQSHLRTLKTQFDKIDLDGSGNIDFDEFFESIGEARSPFTDKLFALIDIDGSGTIEFDEYVRVMATYCMFTKDEILRFCFECFDVDKSGTIDEKEFVELCKCINNAAPSFPNNFKKALEEFDVNEDGLIDYSEFLTLDSRYPLILFPAFRLQDTMQRNSLGEQAWLKVIERYQARKAIEEYKANHGGRLPPDPPLIMLGKAFLPCLFRERVFVKVGMEMEQRHRDT